MKTFVILFVLLIGSSKIFGQESFTIDLARLDVGQSVTLTLNKEYENIIVVNALPLVTYNLEINNTTMLPDVLQQPGQVASAKLITPPTGCKPLADAISALVAFNSGTDRSEKLLAPLRANIEAAMAGCTDPDLIKNANEWLTATKRTFSQTFKVSSSKQVTIKIFRSAAEWTYVLKGEPKGNWLMTYGFGFTTQKLAAPTYHTAQMEGTSDFTIRKTPEPDAADLSYIPALFYSYIPASKIENDFVPTLTAGLGFDMAAPVVFLGGGLIYNYNIGINVGVAFQQQHKLKPQYSEGDALTMSLDMDQLHDSVYRPNLFISIVFRFGENPFNVAGDQ